MSKQIFELIPKIMNEISAVAKLGKNDKQDYMFRQIEDVYNVLHPIMAKYSVFCCPEVIGNEIETLQKEQGKVVFHAVLKIRHRFYAPDESFVDVVTMGEGLDSSDKAINKATSFAFKYALLELFFIPTKDIAEGDRTSPEITRTIILEKPNGKTETPTAALPMPLSEDEELKPAVEEVLTYITPKQRSFLARRFRESLNKELEPKADEYRHAALIALNRLKKYKSELVVDDKPTHDYILSTEYTAIGKELIEAAKNIIPV